MHCTTRPTSLHIAPHRGCESHIAPHHSTSLHIAGPNPLHRVYTQQESFLGAFSEISQKFLLKRCGTLFVCLLVLKKSISGTEIIARHVSSSDNPGPLAKPLDWRGQI
jgi:hypothetical protein